MGNWLIPALLLLLAFVGGVITISIRKLFTDELGHQYNQLPYRLFWLAAKAYPQDEREVRFDEWADDYQAIADRYEDRPLPRIWHGIRFSVSLFGRSGLIGRAVLRGFLRTSKLRYGVAIAVSAAGALAGPALLVLSDATSGVLGGVIRTAAFVGAGGSLWVSFATNFRIRAELRELRERRRAQHTLDS